MTALGTADEDTDLELPLVQVHRGDELLAPQIGAAAALTPRQQLVTVAHAFKADTVPDGSIGTAQIANGSITAAKLAPGVGASGWSLTGNAATNPLANFLGTTDAQPFLLKVNNQRVMRFEDVIDTANNIRSLNVIAGIGDNAVTNNAYGVVIAGGGQYFTNGQPSQPNTVDHSYGVIGGGSLNKVMQGFSIIGGGFNNTAQGDFAIIAGGRQQENDSGDSFLGGGVGNYLDAAVRGQFVGGGIGNVGQGTNAVIAGGESNNTQGTDSVIGGGKGNYAGGSEATVPGGINNSASGAYSFAAGYGASAGNTGSFVWSDSSSSAPTTSPRDNTFTVRAMGGSFINGGLAVTGASSPYPTTTPSGVFVEGGYGSFGLIYAYNYGTGAPVNLALNTPGGNVGIGTTTPLYTLDVNGSIHNNAGIYGSNSTGGTGVYGTGTSGVGTRGVSTSNYGVYGSSSSNYAGYFAGSVYTSGTYNGSDARYKTGIETLNNALDTVLGLRGVTYEYRRDAFPERHFPAGRQMGFIAQEVERSLPELVREDNDGYLSLDYAHVTPLLVEAIKTQQKQMDALKRDNAATLKENVELKARLTAIEAAIVELKARIAADKPNK